MLDRDLKLRDGDDHAFYDQFNAIENLHHVILCRLDEKAIGCGAFKTVDQHSAGIKRMFVLPGYRGQRAGLRILLELERWATEGVIQN